MPADMESLLRREALYRDALTHARRQREKIEKDCAFWLNELNMVKREAYAAGFTGNIFREDADGEDN